MEDRDRLYVIPSETPSAWYSDAVREGGCRVRWQDGRESIASAAPVQDPALVRDLQKLFRSKYGAEAWTAYFEGRTEALEIDPHTAPLPPTASDQIRREFDAAAPFYDAGIARQPIERYLKERVAALARTGFEGLDPILEIGPGTGYHTTQLLDVGHQVVAVDVSERMIRELRTKAERSDPGRRLQTRVGRLGDLGVVLADLPAGYFGGAFSAFGPFNLETDVGAGVRALSRLIRPGGRLLFTSLNRPGLTPLFWELSLARWTSAGYRMSDNVPVGGLRYPLELHLRTPGGWDRALESGFEREWARPVSVLAPPFESGRIVRFLGGRGADRMRRSDAFLASRPLAWMAAEWVLLSYLRRDRAEPGT